MGLRALADDVTFWSWVWKEKKEWGWERILAVNMFISLFLPTREHEQQKYPDSLVVVISIPLFGHTNVGTINVYV